MERLKMTKIKDIFSITNDKDRKHKVVKLLGIKVKIKKISIKEKIKRFQIRYNKNLYIGIPDNLTLQMSFNNDCNCKCKFCCEEIAVKKEDKAVIPEKWLYKDFLPLYKKTTHLVPTYGEITICKEGYNYLQFIHKNYPEINISTETNGIAFGPKWQELAAENLMRINFSLNAVNEDMYKKTVWDQDGIYPLIRKNLDNYLAILKQKNCFAFKPSVSIVINQTNYKTVIDFIKLSLEKELQILVFFIDNALFYDHSYDNIIEETFITLLEIDRLIKDKVYLNYRLFVPINNLDELERKVKQKDINELKNKYESILKMTEKLSTLEELYDVRKAKRNEFGKKAYSFYEELHGTTYHKMNYNGKLICQNPWTHIRVRPNGDTAVCSWVPYQEHQNLKNYIRNGLIDWSAYFNNPYRKLLRYNFSQEEYTDCMKNCPGSVNCKVCAGDK